MTPFVPDAHWIAAVRQLAEEASTLILRYYGKGHAPQFKDDKSPVTEADLAADRLIVEGLRALSPEIPVISEEGNRALGEGATRFFLVDPLDGTKSFVRGRGDFTVNIGLVEDNYPVYGVITLPLAGMSYGGGFGHGAWRAEPGKPVEAIATRQPPVEGLTALVSHSHSSPETEAFVTAHRVVERIPRPSSSKFCYLAAGLADLYPRFGPTSEWDTCAGQAIVEGAGGRMLAPNGERFRYGKKNLRNGNFVAWGK